MAVRSKFLQCSRYRQHRQCHKQAKKGREAGVYSEPPPQPSRAEPSLARCALSRACAR